MNSNIARIALRLFALLLWGHIIILLFIMHQEVVLCTEAYLQRVERGVGGAGFRQPGGNPGQSVSEEDGQRGGQNQKGPYCQGG